MRRIGTLENSELAQRFCDYLVTQSISAICDSESDRQTPSGMSGFTMNDKLMRPKRNLRIFVGTQKGRDIRSSGQPRESVRSRLRLNSQHRSVQQKVLAWQT